jgi:hypothetical protein
MEDEKPDLEEEVYKIRLNQRLLKMNMNEILYLLR